MLSDLRTPRIKRIIPLSTIVEALNIDQLHNEGLTGKGVTIAVLDSGGMHPFFENKVVDTFSVIKGEPVGKTNFFHGSWCAGCIGGKPTTAHYKGQEYRMIGVAPNAKLIIGKCIADNRRGSTASMIKAMNIAVEKGADIVSMSIGSRLNSSDGSILASTLNDLGAKNDVLFVAAAGNWGPSLFSMATPADAERAITVGSHGFASGNTSIFSSRGPTRDGLIKPDVTSLGGDVRSGWAEEILSSGSDGAWQSSLGTSMATPIVAGVLALLLQAGMKKNRDVAEQVMASHTFKTPVDGWGQIDAYQSYLNIDNISPLSAPFEFKKHLSNLPAIAITQILRPFLK